MVPGFNMDHTKKLDSITWLTESTCSDMVHGLEMYTCKPNLTLSWKEAKQE